MGRTLRAIANGLVCTLIYLLASPALAEEEAVTVLTGFEDNSVALRIGDTKNVRASDCHLEPAGIPARTGHRSIKIDIGATVPDAQIGVSLLLQTAVPFEKATRVAAYVCLYEGEISLAYRVLDTNGVVFETPYTKVTQHSQFVRVAADLGPRTLEPLDGGGAKPEGPLEIAGFSVKTPTVGGQVLYIDDLQVEHMVPDKVGLMRGSFVFDRPTHLYEPGDTVAANLQIENLSRSKPFRRLEVELELLDTDGESFGKVRNTIDLPRSGIDYRSVQDVLLEKPLREPGLYRVEGRVRASGWPRPARFESSIAVLPSNRALPRGREAFFGIRTNTLRESLDGQSFEVALADEIGAQLLGLEVDWTDLEPVQDDYRFDRIDGIVRALADRDIGVCLVLQDPPDWLPTDAQAQIERQGLLMESLAKTFGTRTEFFEAAPVSGGPGPTAVAGRLQTYLNEAGVRATVLARPVPLRADAKDEPDVAEVLEGGAEAWHEVLEGRGHDPEGGDRLLVRGPVLLDSGNLKNAVDVLETLVTSAQQGLAGVMWFDLRDDTVDARYRESMRGLVARDFSPKTPLVGYASAVGMLGGLRYVGPLENTPDGFHSALFVGAERQVALLLPHPNVLLPGVLAPVTLEAGTLQPLDFERRNRDVIGRDRTRLIETLDRPLFLAFTAERALKDPVLSLAPEPWLQLPRTVLLGDEATFTVRLTAPQDLNRNRSRVQLLIPKAAQLKSSLSSRRLTASAGEVVEIPITLERDGADRWFEPVQVTLRMTLEGERLDIPLEIRPLGEIQATRGPLVEMQNGEDDSTCAVEAAWSSNKFTLRIAKPGDLGAGGTVAVRLLSEGSDLVAEASLVDPWAKPKRGARPQLPKHWTLKQIDESQVELTVAPGALGLRRFDRSLRLSLQVIEPASLFAGRTWRFATPDDPIWLQKAR